MATQHGYRGAAPFATALTTLRSIGQIARLQRFVDNEKDTIAAHTMLTELHSDNQQLASAMRETHALCDDFGDVATASLLETWIDEAEGRTWFLAETIRR